MIATSALKWITNRAGKTAWLQLIRPEKMTIDHLPDEILEYIFVLAGEPSCSANTDAAQTALRMRTRPVELVVTVVTKRWRTIALGYSRLWGNIRLSSSTSPEMLQLYLDRSGSHALDVEITFTMQKGVPLASRPIREGVLRTLVNVVLQELPRWRQLHISTPFPDLLSVIMCSLGHRHLAAPSLEVLAIECPFQAGLLSGNGNMYPKPFPGGAPHLRHVQLHRCTFPLQHDESLPHLKSFDVASAPWTLSDLHVLSSASPKLAHLAVTSSYKLDTHATLHFPTLRSLRIGDYFQNATILQLIEAPRLEVLQIEDMEVQFNVTAGWYVDALRRDGSHFGEGKFPKLRSLRLQMPGTPEDPSPLIVGQRFSEFLKLFPSIEHLAFVGLHVHQFVRGLVALYSYSDPDDVLLPNLTHLTLGGQSELTTLCGENGVQLFESVMHLVKARRTANIPLRKVQLPANVLARGRFSIRRAFALVRSGNRNAIKIEGLSLPYPTDVWLGYKWGLQMLPDVHDKTESEQAFGASS
ncbi:hypothetical protein DAEQUDRAFT_730987 [Daedalea quercina L-15889]|uniref:F-box domain-containing protein n=1 Tax=Daedalea quercina L-15889 TaxID=1314783 RepID=A0A165MKM4_9APHY|nr:hypothetical protein DAEQUDRAFT_730987 [Daedalea quercina L-15889]